jgi:hypothetical protein
VQQRRYVNAFLGLWIAVLAVDAFRPLVHAQQSIDDAIHPALDVTGLRQFPWRLFAEVPRVNLRFSAILEFPDGATAHWDSPDWRDVSAVHKFVGARELNYFRNFNLFDDESFPQVASGLAAYLARTVPHPQGKPGPAKTVTLFLRGAMIPAVDQRRVPVGPYDQFDAAMPIHKWMAP